MFPIRQKFFCSTAIVTFIILLLYSDVTKRRAIVNNRRFFNPEKLKSSQTEPVAAVKAGGKWIVVTSISGPTEDVKRLSSFADWNLVVVADTKTPNDWELESVHFLSVDYQMNLPFSVVNGLPFKSYTRKNIGYLYAISQGAEWIYDTDDDNKPYGKLLLFVHFLKGKHISGRGLDQFDYEDEVSGIRYTGQEGKGLRGRLFNPYRFFGMDQMWPRGFPLEHLQKHTNGNDSQVLCKRMKRAAVQQGLVHHDPDVDAIYRLLNADEKTGLDVKFNKFGPPITLSVGTYSPWNSQNTLFHRSAFHTLFLPTTVSFRTTDIWRSFISQKILNLSGLSVSFVATNAVQVRNAHDYLNDLRDEKQVYEESGKMLEYLHGWKCSRTNTVECIRELAGGLAEQQFWAQEDVELAFKFISDLQDLGFEFPALIEENYVDPYSVQTNESSRDVNCRRMRLEFELRDPKQEETLSVQKAVQKINNFGEIIDWCNQSGYSNLSRIFPSPEQLAEEHDNEYVLQRDKNTVLIVANNYPWKWGIGVIQRLYQPYFASVIFCGSWYPENISSGDNYTSPLFPLNFVHMNPAEMLRGYFAYHCVTLVHQMRLSNVDGYFLMADDAVFNIWQRIDYSRVHHTVGDSHTNTGNWWNSAYGRASGKRVIEQIEKTKDPKILSTWKRFEDGLRKFGHLKKNETAKDKMVEGKGKSISDFFYIPESEIDYYASLMNIFYESKLFLELAVNRFLRSVNHQTSQTKNSSYLWGKKRGSWDKVYNKNMDAIHPIKMSKFEKSGEGRKRYCASVIQTWANILFSGSRNFTVKQDTDEDYKNG
ncbi:unnamed protein product [Caenorhabditis sp. 36 PRJEB53466]|nr:unnamed protein product [Caenorhabditis sp. 36 PRJEB53466]